MELKTFVWDTEQAGIEVELTNIPTHAEGVMRRAEEFVQTAGIQGTGERPDPFSD